MMQKGSKTIEQLGQANETALGPGGGPATVLLVDDDPMVREIVRETLLLAGYHVLEADNPDGALQHCQQHRGPIHLLLTDVQMPGMNGCRLANLVAIAREETKVLLMSGYADDAVLRYGIEQLGAAYIQKPFLPSSLLNTIRAVLQAGATVPA